MKQSNYIKISSEKYNGSDLSYFQENIRKPDELDLEIAAEILDFQEKIGSIDMGGAWKYYNENTRANYVKSLRQNDLNTLASLLSNMFQTECTSAIITPSINISKDHDLISQMSWDLDACAEFTRGKYPLEVLDTENIGAPFGTIRNNVKILPDSPRHLYFADLIMSKIKDPSMNILEIGGGYGGLISFLRKVNYSGTYYNIDLPETLFVCYYYLRRNSIRVNLIKELSDFKKGEVNLIPSMFYNKLTKELKFDLFFNSASLAEMSQEVCFNYIEMINRSTAKYIIHCNSNFLAFPDSKIHIEVLAKDFPWDPNFELITHYVSPFQGASGRYRVYIYDRVS